MRLLGLAILGALIFYFPSTALANCTNPVGQVGQIVFNGAHDTFQGCTASGWMAIGIYPPGSGGSTNCNNIGETCSDGTIYAGSTVGGARLYAASADEPNPLFWKTSATATPGTNSLTDGLANTNAMEAAGLTDHPAAQACRNRGSGWYLPALDELRELYTYRNSGDLNGTFDEATTYPTFRYWSSTEGSAPAGRYINFNDATEPYSDKNLPASIRCVRR